VSASKTIDDGEILPIEVIVGRNIARWRVERGISAPDFVRWLDLDLAIYLQHEAGELRIPPPLLERISRLLELPVWALFDGVGLETSSTLKSRLAEQSDGEDNRELDQLIKLYISLPRSDRQIVVSLARELSSLRARASKPRS
jgi:hypothetical protein